MNDRTSPLSTVRRAALAALRQEVAAVETPEDEPGLAEAVAALEAGQAGEESAISKRHALGLALMGLGRVDEAVQLLNAEFDAAAERREKRRQAKVRREKREKQATLEKQAKAEKAAADAKAAGPSAKAPAKKKPPQKGAAKARAGTKASAKGDAKAARKPAKTAAKGGRKKGG